MDDRNRELFQKNILALAKKDALLAKALADCPVGGEYRVVSAKSGLPTLKVNKGGRHLLVHSMYDPEEDARALAGKIASIDPENMLVLFGIGLGYHLFELVRLTKGERKILAVESDMAIFKIALHYVDYSPLFELPALAFVVGDDMELLRQRLAELFELYQTPGLSVGEFRQSVNLNREYYRKAGQELKDAISVGVSNYTTIVRHIEEWHNNILGNLESIVKSAGVSSFYDTLQNKPGIVISAGPSLDKNIKELKRAQGKVMMVACDTAYKTLKKHGIEPDIVVSVDGQAGNFKHLEDTEVKDTYLLCSPIVYAKTPKMFEKRIVFNFYFPLSHWIEKIIPKGYLQVGGSVATLAFDFLRQMGASPIIFCGQDLSFPGLKTHAQGTYHDEKWEKSINRFQTLEMYHIYQAIFSNKTILAEKTYDGKPLLTYRILSDYAKWFEYEFSRTHLRIINATEGGILRGKCEQMTLKEALDLALKEEYSPQEHLNEHFAVSADKDIDKLIEQMDKICDSLKKMRKESEEAVDFIRKMNTALKNKDNARFFSLKVKLDRIGKRVESMVGEWGFISHAFQARLWPTMRKLNLGGLFDSMPSQEHEMLEKLNIRYEIFLEISRVLLDSFVSAKDEIDR